MKYFDLPVYKHKDLILSALETSQTIVVESPTGSGKTTQLPVILDSAGLCKNGMIGVTQPRRIAALSVSEFIARQLGTTLPGPIGYKMRFEDKTNRDTRIKIMTDGILLQEMKLDPWLSKYSCIIVDEAHERSLNIDFILGLLKRVLETRKEFKCLISSATINAKVFSDYFDQCPIVKIDAQTYPVTMIYDPPILDSESQAAADILLFKIETIIERIIDSKIDDTPGDILVFLPGEKMIKDCMERLIMGKLSSFLHILPLYGRMAKEEQERVFETTPKGKTKLVIATNIAETSVTIDGITAVIDSGLSKLNYYNPKTYTSSLVEAPVSKASANQRKGRAGRTREGSCYRLYTRKDFENRQEFTIEEIYRTDLSEVVLRMADLGITEFEDFDFISPPGLEGIVAAIETLKLLDALEEDRSLSRIGRLMTEFPLLPRQSRIIVEAILKYPDIIQETVIAVAFLSTQSPYKIPLRKEIEARRAHHNFRDNQGDFVSYLKLYQAYMESTSKLKFCENYYLDERAMQEISNICAQLEEILSNLKIPLLSGGATEDYLCAIGRGLIQFICVRQTRELYRSVTADRIMIHPGSVMFHRGRETPEFEFIVAGEIVHTSRMYAMSVSPLSRSALEKINPDLLKTLGVLSSGLQSHRERYRNEKKKRTLEEQNIKNPRDFTNNVKIGNEIFEIEIFKGKKEVKLPWERLKLVKEDFKKETAYSYKGLRGTITIGDKYTLLRGEKLSLILGLLPTLDPVKALERKLTQGYNYNSQENLDKLLEQLPWIVNPAIWKQREKADDNKNDRRRRRSSGRSSGRNNERRSELGFSGLFTDGEGNYRIKCCRKFHNSLNESLASIETLIDELDEDVDVEKKHIVNQCYRRLSDYLK